MYPNKVVIPMTAMDPMTVKCLDPRGSLGVRVVRATGLPTKGGVSGVLRSWVGQHKPDPYARVCIGATKYMTNVVYDTTEPEWDGKW